MKSLNAIFFLKKYALQVALFVFVASCASPPDYPVEPIIEFNYVTKDTLNLGAGFEDTTFVNFSFTDGDGDIGTMDKDSTISLFVTDLRDGTVNNRKIPFVLELGAANGIKGNITVRIFSSCCINLPDPLAVPCIDFFPDYKYEEVVYSITMKDRAGNVSNEILTTPIYIRCYN